MVNGQRPPECTFTASRVRKALREAKGKPLTAVEITTLIGHPAAANAAPSGALLNIRRILGQMVVNGDASLIENQGADEYFIAPSGSRQ